MSRQVSARVARRRGRLMWRVVVGVTIGMLVLRLLWLLAALVVDSVPMPGWLWAVAALVGPVAVAVYWRPAYRVPTCLFSTGFAAVMLGIGGLGWGSVAAPVIAGATLLGLLAVPRDGGAEAGSSGLSRRGARSGARRR